MKCQWILPQFAKDVEYAEVRDINFKSAQKLKSELDYNIDNLSESKESPAPPKVKEKIPVPTKVEMSSFLTNLSNCKTKPVVLSVVEPFSEIYILPSRRIPTMKSLFKPKYVTMAYPELIDACMNIKLNITKEEIQQISKDTIKQSKGINFFKHRAGQFNLLVLYKVIYSC